MTDEFGGEVERRVRDDLVRAVRHPGLPQEIHTAKAARGDPQIGFDDTLTVAHLAQHRRDRTITAGGFPCAPLSPLGQMPQQGDRAFGRGFIEVAGVP